MNRGKIVIILCMVLLSIQIVSADALNLTTSTNETFADNRTVWITANLTNATGYPINNTRVNFTADCGILSAGYNYTNTSGIAVVNISSWDLCTANITAEAPNATNATINVTFVRGPISQIVLSANSSGTVNTTHLVTATVYDSELRLMPNVLLNFTITPPPTTYNSVSIAPSNTTDESGYTTATARIDKRAGTNHIHVNVTNEDGVVVAEDTAIVGLAGEATNITVTASPENVSANGIDLSHVTGKVTDEFGNPLLSTGAIRFNVTDSDPTIKPLNSVGEATMTIRPSKFTGSVVVNGTYINVTGDYTNLTDSATVIFYEEEPARVVVTADATKISTSDIPGVNISTITATVIDKWGHTLPGRTVDFVLDGPGTLALPTTKTTDSHGQVTITLQSDISGDSTVTAKVLNDSGYAIEGSIAIQIMDKPFVSVITTIEPDPVEPGGIINVTTSVSGQGNITGIYLAAHAMLTLDRSGSMDPDYYAGTPLDVVLVIDNSGSMSGTKIKDAKMAAKTFVSQLSSVNRVAIYAFDGADLESPKMYLNWVLLNSSQNRTLVNDTIDGLSANCWTPIWDTIGVACVKASYHRSYAIPVVVALTDGDDWGATDGREKGSEGYAPWHDWDTSELIGTITRYYGGSDHSISINEDRNGLLNAPFLIYTIGLNVSPHNTGYENGNNDPGKWTGDYLKTTEYDLWSVSRTSDWNNKHGRYYYAPNSSELSEIYNNIAQEISDYDITEISYGYDGFTPYNYGVQDTIPGSGTWTDNFTINETINDFKIELEWSGSDLNLSLTSPGGHVYGAGGDTTGYTGAGSNPEYIWINPLAGQYPQSDMNHVEPGNWTITASGISGQAFNITTYIDKKSAAQIASHAFISSLDPTREDRVGLATYSYSSTNETSTQESYVCQGNQWEGYFTVDSYAIYYFNLSWADASDLDLYLYDGITLLNSSATDSNPEMASAALSPGTNYRIAVNGTNVIGNDTQFTINVYSTIETVNSGTTAFLGESTTVDIPPVDLNKTFLIVKSSDNHDLESNTHAFTIRGHFIDNDTIEFTRESSSVEGEVSYFIIQADNIEVQSGTEVLAKGDIQANVPITSVTDHATKCFVTLSTSSDNKLSNYVHESWVTGELTAPNILTLKRANSKSKVTVDWFVIRFTDNTTVQTGVTSWSGVQANRTITSVNTSNTWLYFTSRMDDNGLAHTSIKGEITDSTTLTFSKHSDSTTGADVSYFVIEFPEDSGATVQSGTASASSGDLTVDIGITPVNRKRALAFVTNDCEGTGNAYAMSYWISYFTADNNLKMQRWYTGEPVVHKWQVVEWPEGTSVGIVDTPVNWLEWRAQINNSLTDSIVSFDPINDSIDNLTADGMTAIDEGLYEANNALYDYFAAVSKPIENGTIILMTDGIDNVGYHSMIAEAERAAANNTTIFTVGFGSTIDDRVLRQIANITGGEYYFAPNATVLKNIFVGIAGELGNFTAPEPTIAIRLGNNAIVEGVLANVTYINDSANVTYFNCTLADCSEGQYESEYLNPNITYEGDRTILSWDIGNRPDRIITVGKYWTVTYQLRIDNASAGYVPIILYPSCVTYESAGGEGNCSNNLVPDANVDVVGKPDPSPNHADSIELTNKSVSGGPPFRTSPKPDTVQEYAYRLTAYLKDADSDPMVELGAVVEFKSTSGTLYNYTHHNTSGLLNETIGLGGTAIVWLSSDVPGTITVCAYHTANGTELTPACNVVIFHSLESPPIIPPAPRPRGVITLESDPFMTDWFDLWRNR